MEKVNKSWVPVWSNAPFLIPAGIALYYSAEVYAVIILIAAIVSYFHHTKDGETLAFVDQVMAYSLITTNLYFLYQSGFRQPYTVLAVFFVVVAFYFFFTGKDEKYDLRHGLWHLASVMITLMCVLAYSL